MKLTIHAWGRSWDASAYTGVRQFHQGKGFDPDSQDVARHLGYPLYELSPEMESLFAHVEPVNPGSEEEPDLHDHDEVPPLSKPFKFTMNAQLAFITFLAVVWLCEHVRMSL
ncbi:hypothetical protein B0H13DRAFT_2064236, partial [Mycena leptocephala]